MKVKKGFLQFTWTIQTVMYILFQVKNNYLFQFTHSNLEKVLTQTSSSRSHRLTNASALPVAKYLIKNKKEQTDHLLVKLISDEDGQTVYFKITSKPIG